MSVTRPSFVWAVYVFRRAGPTFVVERIATLQTLAEARLLVDATPGAWTVYVQLYHF